MRDPITGMTVEVDIAHLYPMIALAVVLGLLVMAVWWLLTR